MLGFWERQFLDTFAAGPLPAHVGIVLDGNRRWARQRGMTSLDGYDKGMDVLLAVLEKLLYMGINHITAYMLSIENFKRPKEDIDHLWKLGTEHFRLLCGEDGLLTKYRIKLCVVGRRSFIPDDVLKIIEECEENSKNYDRGILNVCMAYTCRDEIVRGVDSIVQRVRGGELSVDDISHSTLASEMEIQARGNPPLDILLRTGCVRRLSDFLTWQMSANRSQLQFPPLLWPQWGGVWTIVTILLAYQRKARAQRKITKRHSDTLIL